MATRQKFPQRRPNLRPITQRKWDTVRVAAGWDSDAEVADRLADFFIETKGIQFNPSERITKKHK